MGQYNLHETTQNSEGVYKIKSRTTTEYRLCIFFVDKKIYWFLPQRECKFSTTLSIFHFLLYQSYYAMCLDFYFFIFFNFKIQVFYKKKVKDQQLSDKKKKKLLAVIKEPYNGTILEDPYYILDNKLLAVMLIFYVFILQ